MADSLATASSGRGGGPAVIRSYPLSGATAARPDRISVELEPAARPVPWTESFGPAPSMTPELAAGGSRRPARAFWDTRHPAASFPHEAGPDERPDLTPLLSQLGRDSYNPSWVSGGVATTH